MHQHLARVEEDVKRAILATTLGIELKPAQVGLKVQGRELKLAWAQLLATLLLACPRVMAVWPNIGMWRACCFLLMQVVNCSIKRHGVPPVLRNIGEAIASDLRVTKMCVTARECETRPPSVLISEWAAMYCCS